MIAITRLAIAITQLELAITPKKQANPNPVKGVYHFGEFKKRVMITITELVNPETNLGEAYILIGNSKNELHQNKTYVGETQKWMKHIRSFKVYTKK